MRIVWDEPKRQRNLRPEPEGHGLDFADVEDGFDFGSAQVTPTKPGRDGRRRYRALGYLDRRLCALFFSPLGSEGISLISLRPASAKERKVYDEAQRPPPTRHG
ncbi:BrnT family toxin (plasmid) [Methylobacterium currus]|uniref:BrnT family toxin n=1 Tax=Methylobacterium currus TaxID=2051553 RepID=UPI001E35A80C|nr:BrnT family toxin [Methylobacterium currus]UHC20464.1 BrnT family toxin [Methylobacterium currus]